MDTNRSSRCRLAWIEPLNLHVFLDRFGQRLASVPGNLVTATRRPFFTASDALVFPARFHEAGVLEFAEDRIDGAARQAGGIHDVESVHVSGGDRLQDLDGRETHWPIHDLCR